MGERSKKQQMFSGMKARKNEVKKIRRIVAAITIIAILILAISGFSMYKYVKEALQPYDSNATNPIALEVPMGSGITSISELLEKNGLIKDARIFKYYAKFRNESQFQAGSYSLTQSMTIDEIIETLKTGKLYREPVFTMTVPEGYTLTQIAQVVEKNTKFTAEQFMDKVTDEVFINLLMADYPELLKEDIKNENIKYDLEGYLYPATYPFFEESPTLDEVIRVMVKQMNDVVLQYRNAIAEKNWTVHQYLTFASLLEEEATAQTDRETIASVFYNRLAIDMPLQTDPTVLYSLGSHKDRVLYEDLEVKDPYNTYKNKGLPPGPIAGAGKISLEATLNPSKTDYLFFLADKQGVNHFSLTYEEHQQKVAKYIK